jgi:hypothetical protein
MLSTPPASIGQMTWGSSSTWTLKTLIAICSIGVGLVFAGDHGRDRDYSDLRGLVDRVQSDLRAASDLEHGNKQRDRYHNAQDNLSKFDRNLSKGKFDKGALDHSINGVKDILEHNTLQGSNRDLLRRDLADLKIAREDH